MRVMGVDPGNKGAFVVLSESGLEWAVMPLDSEGVCFEEVVKLLMALKPAQIALERAVPFAMGTKGAFTYGRGFAALEIAIKVVKIPVTYVEPTKWTKEIFSGIDKRLKPKERGHIAIERLFPHLLDQLPRNKNGVVHEGVQDALLIAEWGRRNLGELKHSDF